MIVSKKHPGIKQFMIDTRNIADKNKIKIRISRAEFIRDKESTSKSIGYFDAVNKELASSNYDNHPVFLRNFVHESCHMDQFLNHRFLWDKCEPGYNLFFNWLEGNSDDETIEDLKESVQDIIRLELDCEKRTVEKIKKYGLPIDITDYIKRANAYMFGYLFFLKHKKWIPAIYNNKQAVNVAPSRFCKKYTKIPGKLEKVFNKFL